MGAVVGLISGVIAALIARAKGFKPLRWILALGIIGFITVLCLPSAEAAGIPEMESKRRADNANTVGAVMTWINIGLGLVVLLLLAAIS
ncbi:MAG: hypothetical protein ACOX5G_02785 [Kiritimatiellia bacterium]|jgi:hypothetical protein